MAKRGVGRPPKFTMKQIRELMVEFTQYIETEIIPTVAGFAADHKLGKNYFYDRAEFSELIKRCHSKREAGLERGAISGEINPTVAIFALKQLGWRDKFDYNVTVREGLSEMMQEARERAGKAAPEGDR